MSKFGDVKVTNNRWVRFGDSETALSNHELVFARDGKTSAAP
jgi:hypothetical protein